MNRYNLNSKQKKVYQANLYVMGHREMVGGKMVVSKPHDYPLCTDCKYFKGHSLTKSVCNQMPKKTLCQYNRVSDFATEFSNGCGNSGRYFVKSDSENYVDANNRFVSGGGFWFWFILIVIIFVSVFK